MTANAAVSPSVVTSKPGFGSALLAEFTKLRSVRSTYMYVLLGIGLSIGMTALIALAIGSSWDDMSPEDRAAADGAEVSLFGTVFGFILFSVLAVTFVTNEYSTGAVRLSIVTVPQRGRWLAAKVLVLLVLLLIASMITAFACFFAGQAVLSSYDANDRSLSDPGVFSKIFFSALGTPALPLIGFAIGIILRNTAGAVTSILALVFAPAIFGGILPDWWQENVIRMLPSAASDNLARFNDPGTLLYMERLSAGLLLLGWVALALLVAYVMLKRRDV